MTLGDLYEEIGRVLAERPSASISPVELIVNSTHFTHEVGRTEMGGTKFMIWVDSAAPKRWADDGRDRPEWQKLGSSRVSPPISLGALPLRGVALDGL